MGQRSIQATLGGLAGAGLVTALVLAAGLMAFTSWLHTEVRTQGVAVESVRAAEEIEVQLLEAQRYAVLRAAFDGEQEDATRRDQAWADLWRWLEISRQHVTSPEEAASLAELEARIGRVREVWEEVRSESSEEGSRASSEEVVATQEAVSEAITSADRLIAINLHDARSARDSAQILDDASNVLGVGLAALIVAVLAVAGWSMRRLLTRPLEEVRAAIVRFGDGDLRSRAPTDGPVEIAEIASTFNETADALDRQRRGQLAFVASVAHDLKNPLHALKLAAAVAERGGSEAKARANVLVLRQVDRLVRMVDDLMDASRIEAGELELRLEDTDVVQLAREVIDLFRGTTERHELVLSGDGPAIARLDATRLSQVLTNLVSNAIKYSPEGGRVTVRVEATTSEVHLSVSDQGIGIPVEEQGALFQPFRRAKGGRSVAVGAGLGLSVARRIVLAHGGTLDLHSRPGVGSTFHVHLPRLADADATLASLEAPTAIAEPP